MREAEHDTFHVHRVVVRELQLELLAGRDATPMVFGGLRRGGGGHGGGDELRKLADRSVPPKLATLVGARLAERPLRDRYGAGSR